MVSLDRNSNSLGLSLACALMLCQGGPPPSNLSSRPERTRISYIATPPAATYAASRKGSRKNFANATDLNRKSGVAQWRDLRFALMEKRNLEAIRSRHPSHRQALKQTPQP